MKNYLSKIVLKFEKKIQAAREFVSDKEGSVLEWIMTNKIVALGAAAVLGLFIAAVVVKVNGIITSLNAL